MRWLRKAIGGGVLAAAVLLAAAAVGCSDNGGRAGTGAVTELVGTEIGTSTDELDLMLVHDLDVDTRGFVYLIGHPEQVTVLGPNGRRVRSIGRQGAGPGEFLGVASIDVGTGDSLFVYDMQLHRLTVYDSSAAGPRQSVQLREGFPMFPFMVRPTGDGRLLALYRLAYGDGTGRAEGREQFDVLRLLGPDGALLRDSVVLLREQKHIEVADGRGSSIFHNPFSPESLVRTAGGGVATAWTDSLRFTVYSPDGELLRTIEPQTAATRHPITAAERDSLIEYYAEDRPIRPALRRAIDRFGYTHWPVLHDFMVDDRGWIWYALHPPRGATEIEWTAVDERGAPRERLALPANARLWTVRGRTAYVSETDSLDVPRVVIYELTPVLRGGGGG